MTIYLQFDYTQDLQAYSYALQSFVPYLTVMDNGEVHWSYNLVTYIIWNHHV